MVSGWESAGACCQGEGAHVGARVFEVNYGYLTRYLRVAFIVQRIVVWNRLSLGANMQHEMFHSRV